MLHHFWNVVLPALVFWHRGKLLSGHLVALGQDSIHILVGIFLWVLAGALSRRPLTALLPWLIVLGVTAWDQWVDLVLEKSPNRAAQYAHSIQDVLLTMLVPTALMLVARLRPELFRSPVGARRRQ